MEGVLERWDDLHASGTEWSALAGEAGNLFATWEWADAWCRHSNAAGTAHVFAVRDPAGRLVAILPLWLTSIRGLRVVRFIGHDSGDHLGPIHVPGAEDAAANGLIGALEEMAPVWDLLLAENLPGRALWEQRLGAATLRRSSTATVPIDGQTWAEYLAHRSGRLRRLRTYERRLARDHAVRYRLADSRDRLQDDLDVLFALHSRRWGDRSPALGPARRAFHGDFAARALDRGWLRLWFLEVDDSPVAAWYGFGPRPAPPAAPLILFGLPNMEKQRTNWKIEIPHASSLILTHTWNGRVPGLLDVPAADRPYAPVVFWTFRVMVGLGFLMFGLGAWSLWARWRGTLFNSRWLHRAALLMAPAPIVAMLCGWMTTEIGRQPYTVYGVLRTIDSVSPIALPGIATSLAIFAVVYFIVFGAGVAIILRLMSRPPVAGEPEIRTDKPIRTAGIHPGLPGAVPPCADASAMPAE